MFVVVFFSSFIFAFVVVLPFFFVHHRRFMFLFPFSPSFAHHCTFIFRILFPFSSFSSQIFFGDQVGYEEFYNVLEQSFLEFNQNFFEIMLELATTGHYRHVMPAFQAVANFSSPLLSAAASFFASDSYHAPHSAAASALLAIRQPATAVQVIVSRLTSPKALFVERPEIVSSKIREVVQTLALAADASSSSSSNALPSPLLSSVHKGLSCCSSACRSVTCLSIRSLELFWYLRVVVLFSTEWIAKSTATT